MKKIAIYSFFESYNIGDVLIASQVKKIFSSNFEYVFFDIGSGKPDFECVLKKQVYKSKSSGIKKSILKTPFIGDLIRTVLSLKSKNYKNICAACEDCDTVIFAGGNQVMELNKFPTAIVNLYRTVKIMKENGKKVCFCFCGIGPFNSSISKRIAKKLFSMADFISVRDEYSLKWINEFLPENRAEIWCDPVLLMTPEEEPPHKKNAIGINVYFGHDSRYKKAMKNAYIEIIKNLRKQLKDTAIFLFSSEITDMDNIHAVKSSFIDDDMVVIRNIKSVDELFKFYGEIDSVLASRMHTAITATISKLPILSVAWQNKVTAFMRLMDNSHLNYSVEEFVTNPYSVAEKLIHSMDNSEAIVKKNGERLILLRKDTTKKIEEFINQLED